MRRIIESRSRPPETSPQRPMSEPQSVAITLENQTRQDVAGQLSRAVVPLVWTWAATRRRVVDSWKLVAFSARSTLASVASGQQRLAYDRLMIVSEVLSAEAAAARFLSLDLGPIASELGLEIRLAGDSYIANRLPSGTSLGIGPT